MRIVRRTAPIEGKPFIGLYLPGSILSCYSLCSDPASLSYDLFADSAIWDRFQLNWEVGPLTLSGINQLMEDISDLAQIIVDGSVLDFDNETVISTAPATTAIKEIKKVCRDTFPSPYPLIKKMTTKSWITSILPCLDDIKAYTVVEKLKECNRDYHFLLELETDIESLLGEGIVLLDLPDYLQGMHDRMVCNAI